ncbi:MULTISPECIES: hypothetical protein [Catenuloplanes]|uniref:Uncharacterized protein n=1 Tax=Catenuloplanes niger TaxID=587534 RepID=A0AAE4CTN5_9ACTN|nr:hypothetical protein [Catenuloplanes niger]MDR7324310.1 hypothetical protein [Catenuloplanes niger]
MAIDNGRPDWTGTPWHHRDIPFMWAAVAHHTPDAYAPHLAGWRRTTELLSEHVARMRTYRDNLAIAWNPTRSPAAAIYLARFDTDIANAQATLDASVANYTAYTAALTIVSEAQTRLRPIFDEYTTNTAAEAARQEMTSASNGRAGAAAFMAAPDTERRQAELTAIARSVMYRASQELIEATAALQIAPKYENRSPVFTPLDNGMAPPSIPTVIPLPQATQSSLVTDATGPGSQQGSNETVGGPILSHATTSPQGQFTTNPRSDYTHNIQQISTNPSSNIIGTPSPIPNPNSRHRPTETLKNGLIIGAPTPLPHGPIKSSGTPPTKSAVSNSTASTFPFVPPLAGSSRQLIDLSIDSREPDSAWASDVGVNQIITADPTPRAVDPGPAIGLDQ